MSVPADQTAASSARRHSGPGQQQLGSGSRGLAVSSRAARGKPKDLPQVAHPKASPSMLQRSVFQSRPRSRTKEEVLVEQWTKRMNAGQLEGRRTQHGKLVAALENSPPGADSR